MDDGNKAVYLDVDKGFTTNKVALTKKLSSPVIMSSIHSKTGETNNVIGKHDGSPYSNTSGKFPYRIQGTEYALGAYIIASDTVMILQSDYSKNVYVAKKGIAHSTNDSVIKDTYTLVGNIPASANGKGSDYCIGDVCFSTGAGVWYPSSESASYSQGFQDSLQSGGKTTSGLREYSQGGNLGLGSSSGSAYLACD